MISGLNYFLNKWRIIGEKFNNSLKNKKKIGEILFNKNLQFNLLNEHVYLKGAYVWNTLQVNMM